MTKPEEYKGYREGEPWLPREMVGYLDLVIEPDFHIFEWGSGGSTLWFAERAERVVSVEHDQEFAEAIIERLEGRGLKNWKIHVRPRGSIEYANVILDHEPFDLILIDGKDTRKRCVDVAMKRIKPGGLIIEDNSETGRLNKDSEALTQSGWDYFRIESRGVGGRWECTAWRAPA